MRVLIIGCGYLGLPLGRDLAREGHEVFGLRRSPEPTADVQAAGIIPLAGDITDQADVAALPGPFDWIVNTVSSSKGGPEQFRRVFIQGTRNLLQRFEKELPRKFIFTSSTSVYGQTDGSQVKETSPAEPAGDTGKILVETENLLLDADPFPAVILRLAGIYGPGRGHLFQQFLRNEAIIHGRGERMINMVHRDDAAGAIRAALKHGRKGEIYNVADDEAVTQVNFFRWLSESLGKPMPPFAPELPDAERKRPATNKRVLNRKLKMELGYSFVHPNFRQGYTAEMLRLDRAGLLDTETTAVEQDASGEEPVNCPEANG
jgi:nucleoside-diphosphate-sugar epimerase